MNEDLHSTKLVGLFLGNLLTGTVQRGVGSVQKDNRKAPLQVFSRSLRASHYPVSDPGVECWLATVAMYGSVHLSRWTTVKKEKSQNLRLQSFMIEHQHLTC